MLAKTWIIKWRNKMFLTENELKDKFWKSYNGNNRALRYQFECSIREGNADLVTVEKYQENFQINAFEFKLTDIRKVIRQAEENAKLVNKSWIVIPADRKSVISDKYIGACKEKGIGKKLNKKLIGFHGKERKVNP